MSASPRCIAISARQRISRPCSANSPATRLRGSPRYANDLPHFGRPVRAEIQRGESSRRAFYAACAGAGPAAAAFVARGGISAGGGWPRPGGRPHAEPEALKRAGEAARGATLYVTLEPCSHFGRPPPCADGVVPPGVSPVR